MIGFEKRAGMVAAIKRMKTPLLVGSAVGLTGAAAGSLVKNTEDPEQAKLRQLRKLNALPYQGQQHE